jgi:type III pantothenate kinase|tara:strand:+ start:143 stop:874 length:732 start_codon:yes stop_codon:yes gene_type:complete
MKLIIDIGNTNAKLAVYDLKHQVDFFVTPKEDFNKVTKQVFLKYEEIKKIILSSVSDCDINILKKNFTDKEISILDYNFKFPFTNNYKTLKTIGLDRLVLVTAAFDKFPNKNVLVIDAGTCITYDYIGSNKIYQGGAISPGLRMRYESLNKQTKNLPLLDPKLPDTIIGNSTKNSIHSGVVFGIINEIEGVINQYNKEFVDLTVVLTGGDANFLCKQLKSSIFVFSNFLLEGLNFLLEFNSKK